MKQPIRFATALALALILAVGACTGDAVDTITSPSFGVVGLDDGPPSNFTVYTQNMWLGGETGPLFSLPFDGLASPDPAVQQQALAQIIQGANVFYADVQASDIPARAAEIVDEIASNRPDVVALQEPVAYATGTLNLATFEFTPTAAGPNLLGSVMAEIGARGLPYGIAAVQPTTSIALPVGPPDESGLFPAVGAQDMVVLLAHDDLEITDVGQGVYTAGLPIGPTSVVRGWARVTVDNDGMPYHFVGTHLEQQGTSASGDPIRAIHNAQAAELQGVLASLEGNVILMGDLNSDANGDPSKPSWTPTYGNLVDAGFIDIWATAPHQGVDDGITCCFEPDRTPDERIDFVLLRQDASLADRDHGQHRGFYRVDIVGDEVADQTPGGLWPSDHAGIVATLSEPTLMH